jgi:hypothetical protein
MILFDNIGKKRISNENRDANEHFHENILENSLPLFSYALRGAY